MAHSELTDLERRFLASPPQMALARIATVDEHGMPHVVPCGWSFDPDRRELVLGGRGVPRTRRAQHVRDTGVAAVVIDGVLTHTGWSPWALTIRGHASVRDTEGVIRLSCDRIHSWGLESLQAATPPRSPGRDGSR
jgi:pyridoxamine 5'-phosphate oxidase family protein